jgi:hypothetical protein
MQLLRIGCIWIGIALAFAVGPVRAADSTASPRFIISEDGASVIDRHSKLVWSRCVEGMQWNGRICSGEPKALNHGEATMLAKARKDAESVNWRLPRVPELQQLVNKKAGLVGLDPVLFPAAPRDWHWSATVVVDTTPVNQYSYGNVMQGLTNDNVNRLAFLHGWAVNLESGAARGDVTKRTKLHVRLVRTQG